MSRYSKKPEQSSQSFLPEDYLRQKADRRMGFVALLGFLVVMLGVTGTFFFINRQSTEVMRKQESINREFAAEAKKIDQLKELQRRKAELMDKAEIATALNERVPRSILLAEMINRMPEHLTLQEFGLVGKRVQAPPPSALPRTQPKPQTRSLAGAKPAEAPQSEPAKPQAPRFDFKIELIGLAATDTDVADYHRALQECELLDDVELLYSGETTIDEVKMRKFRLEAKIKPTADARNIEPLQVPRLAGLPGAGPTTILPPETTEMANPQPTAAAPTPQAPSTEEPKPDSSDLVTVSPREE